MEISSLVMSAKQNEMLVRKQRKHLFLAERFSLGRQVDTVRLMLRVQSVDGAADRLGHHHHARAPAEGIIVALEVFIFRIVAEIDDVYFYFSRLPRPAENTLLQCGKHFGKKG